MQSRSASVDSPVRGRRRIDVLRARNVKELRPKLGRPEREDLTLELWLEIIEETRQRQKD